jgi:hypothetical protein
MQPFDYINSFSPGIRILMIAALALCAHFLVRALKQVTQLLLSPKTGVGVSAREGFVRRYPKLATLTTILVSAL